MLYQTFGPCSTYASEKSSVYTQIHLARYLIRKSSTFNTRLALVAIMPWKSLVYIPKYI